MSGCRGPEAFVLLDPAMLPIVVLSVVPLMRGIYLGFTDSHAGLRHRRRTSSGSTTSAQLIHDGLFVNSFKIGLIWAF